MYFSIILGRLVNHASIHGCSSRVRSNVASEGIDHEEETPQEAEKEGELAEEEEGISRNQRRSPISERGRTSKELRKEVGQLHLRGPREAGKRNYYTARRAALRAAAVFKNIKEGGKVVKREPPFLQDLCAAREEDAFAVRGGSQRGREPPRDAIDKIDKRGASFPLSLIVVAVVVA